MATDIKAREHLFDKNGNEYILYPVTKTENIIGLTEALAATKNDAVDDAQAYTDQKAETLAPKSHASTATTHGAADASNYGHAKASTTTPKVNDTALVGNEVSSFARGDHVHPLGTVSTYAGGSCYSARGTTGAGYTIEVPNIDATVRDKIVTLSFSCYARDISGTVPTNLFTLAAALRPSGTRYIALTCVAGNYDGSPLNPCEMSTVYASINSAGVVNPNIGWSSFWGGWTHGRSYRFHCNCMYPL